MKKGLLFIFIITWFTNTILAQDNISKLQLPPYFSIQKNQFEDLQSCILENDNVLSAISSKIFLEEDKKNLNSEDSQLLQKKILRTEKSLNDGYIQNREINKTYIQNKRNKMQQPDTIQAINGAIYYIDYKDPSSKKTLSARDAFDKAITDIYIFFIVLDEFSTK